MFTGTFGGMEGTSTGDDGVKGVLKDLDARYSSLLSVGFGFICTENS